MFAIFVKLAAEFPDKKLVTCITLCGKTSKVSTLFAGFTTWPLIGYPYFFLTGIKRGERSAYNRSRL
jgi:hypothetical protein